MDEENAIVTSFPDLLDFYKDFDCVSISEKLIKSILKKWLGLLLTLSVSIIKNCKKV